MSDASVLFCQKHRGIRLTAAVSMRAGIADAGRRPPPSACLAVHDKVGKNYEGRHHHPTSDNDASRFRPALLPSAFNRSPSRRLLFPHLFCRQGIELRMLGAYRRQRTLLGDRHFNRERSDERLSSSEVTAFEPIEEHRIADDEHRLRET